MTEGDQGTTNARLSRLEGKYDELARVIDRVEQNQKHAEELNVLRFKALDTAVGQIGADLKGFMARIEGLIDGTVDSAQSRQGRALVDDYKLWRKEVDTDRDAQAVRNGRMDLIGKVVWGIVGGNIVAITGAILFIATGHHV